MTQEYKKISDEPRVRASALLDDFSPTQLKKVFLFYKMPKSEIPPAGMQGEQTIALIEYALQKEGEQLTKLFEVIYEVAPDLRDKADNSLKTLLPEKQKSKDIPRLLLHLPNRKRQESKLRKAIEEHQKKQHPLLCLIHGDEKQCGDMFLKRLCEYYLPNLDSKYNAINPHLFFGCQGIFQQF